MHSLLTLTKIQGKLATRTLDGIIFGIGMPVCVLLLIEMIAGNHSANGADYTFLDSSFASLLAVGICATAFMGIPLTICDYRDKKILKHFFVTPVSPLVVILAQFIVAALTAIASAVIVIFVGIVFLNYQMQGSWLKLIGGYFLVMFSMYGLGLLIASLCKNLKIANVVCTFVYFPMLFLSGAVIPFELFPKVVQQVATVLPLTQGIKLLKSITLAQPLENQGMIISYLVLLGILTFVVAIKIFRWE
ncbi:ABC transporter permease [Enterococcus alishanensis]|uniref:Transport permease protein n=1 Tax=Enterococcus alishanensis TaxID=1303817 RepID=A0ABS6TH48_9ENTE|nr:ABC transporter permease [Enterococcus alishanensis]MBV7392299.1 ABC transporter permease [Enterococcus alishanensis]